MNKFFKFILCGLFLLSSIEFEVVGYPGFSDKKTSCALSYFEFCSKIDKAITNMCPEKVEESMKKNCLVSDIKKQMIIDSCKKELTGICSKKTFSQQYLCLTHPKNWSKFSKSCLSSLSSGFHGEKGHNHNSI